MLSFAFIMIYLQPVFKLSHSIHLKVQITIKCLLKIKHIASAPFLLTHSAVNASQKRGQFLASSAPLNRNHSFIVLRLVAWFTL